MGEHERFFDFAGMHVSPDTAADVGGASRIRPICTAWVRLNLRQGLTEQMFRDTSKQPSTSGPSMPEEVIIKPRTGRILRPSGLRTYLISQSSMIPGLSILRHVLLPIWATRRISPTRDH